MQQQLETPVYHVMPDSDGDWVVKKEGHDHLFGVVRSQKRAISLGTSFAEAGFGRLVIHDENNRIREHRDLTQGPSHVARTPGLVH